jgi:hypothetical protein
MRYLLALVVPFVLLLGGCGSDEQQQPAEPATSAGAVPGAVPDLDPVSGLKMTGDWRIVRSACTGCHSGKQITQQRGTAEQWLTMIRWMQAKQNLWQFDQVTEDKIIAYLAENYPPAKSQRRALLTGDQLPPNPYATTGGL